MPTDILGIYQNTFLVVMTISKTKFRLVAADIMLVSKKLILSCFCTLHFCVKFNVNLSFPKHGILLSKSIDWFLYDGNIGV